MSHDETYEKHAVIRKVNRKIRKKIGAKCFTIPTHRPSAEVGTWCDLPDFRPCFSMIWGDSQRDQIETDDVEQIFIKAENPYRNLTIRDLTILNVKLTCGGGPVSELPDHSASVSVNPSHMVAFGDLEPLDEVARQFTLISRGAVAGNYELTLEYCYTVEFEGSENDHFHFHLVQS